MLPETALPVPSPRGEGLGEGGRATNFLPHFSVMRLEIILFNARPHPGLLPGEKEKRSLRFLDCLRRDSSDGHPKIRNRQCLFPLPGGEG